MEEAREVTVEVENGKATFRRNATKASLEVINNQDDVVMELSGMKLAADLQRMCESLIKKHRDTLRELLDELLTRVSKTGDSNYTIKDTSKHRLRSRWENKEGVIHVVIPGDGNYQTEMNVKKVPEVVSDAAVISAMMECVFKGREKILVHVLRDLLLHMERENNVN